jgi:hypothetical protein
MTTPDPSSEADLFEVLSAISISGKIPMACCGYHSSLTMRRSAHFRCTQLRSQGEPSCNGVTCKAQHSPKLCSHEHPNQKNSISNRPSSRLRLIK